MKKTLKEALYDILEKATIAGSEIEKSQAVELLLEFAGEVYTDGYEDGRAAAAKEAEPKLYRIVCKNSLTEKE